MKLIKLGATFLLAAQLVVFSSAAVTANHLQCEYSANPLGLEAAAPRLAWQLDSVARGERQTAYRILVASSAALLRQGQGDLWDSGKVDSDQSIQVHYAGRPLAAREQCFWQVQVWDQSGQPGDWSSVATWEMGLTAPADWSGAGWIQLASDPRHSPLAERPVQTKGMSKPHLRKAHPAPMFRREFVLKAGVVRARAYVCGLGYNEIYVNGQRCGDSVLDPGQTTYDVRAFYVTHDITKMLTSGTNAVGLLLGNGFYGQNLAFNTEGLGYAAPAIVAKVVVDYADGTSQVIGTDAGWKADTGPIVFDNVYAGESYDARLEKAGWNQPGFNDSQWSNATQIASPTKVLTTQMIPPIRRIETLTPQNIIAGKNGKWIFDLGRNIAGWAKLKVTAPAGTVLSLKYAEVLMPAGQSLDVGTAGVFATGVEQIDVYVCKGGGEEIWSPRFTYHGFRYIEVTGLKAKPDVSLLTGVLVHTDAPRNGTFACSDELLNRIYHTSIWTIEDNMHSVMEDCPHREKCGWLGDAQTTGETTIYNFDTAQFWTKFVDDIGTVLGRGGATYWGQKATPGIPCNIAVGKRLCQEARPDWGAAYVMLPWYLYTYYGDTDVFTRHYNHLKDWINYVCTLREDGIVIRGYGDWCPPGGNSNMECPPPLTSTAFFYGTLNAMTVFAQQLGQAKDAATFAKLAAETRTAFNQRFLDPKTGGYGSQTADAVALRFGIFPDGQGAMVAKALRDAIMIQHTGHAFVGIHGARPLYTQLCAYGYEDVAIATMREKTWPSFACTLGQGFTTWPEQADESDPVNRTTSRSLNHPMQSGFAAWFHESVGGIRPAAPGFKRIALDPHGYTQIAWARVEHVSPYGPILSEWHNDQGKFTWKISVPANTTATVSVPVKAGGVVTEGGQPAAGQAGINYLRSENGRAIYDVVSGVYTFQSTVE